MGRGEGAWTLDQAAALERTVGSRTGSAEGPARLASGRDVEGEERGIEDDVSVVAAKRVWEERRRGGVRAGVRL